jgi:hypothetical protein
MGTSGRHRTQFDAFLDPSDQKTADTGHQKCETHGIGEEAGR